MIPVVSLFLYSSKYLITGLTAGGVKGQDKGEFLSERR